MIYTYVCVPHFLPSLQWNVQVAAGKAGMDAYLRHEFFGSRISFCWITPQMTGRCWVQILLRVICYTSGPDPLLPSDTKMIQWKSLAWSHRDWVPFYLRLASEIFQVLRVIFLRSKRKKHPWTIINLIAASRCCLGLTPLGKHRWHDIAWAWWWQFVWMPWIRPFGLRNPFGATGGRRVSTSDFVAENRVFGDKHAINFTNSRYLFSVSQIYATK